ncbi:AGC family protein kinase [Tritrichomonas foetus]|uniref:non-specific serine/threonine protein kinase n=1 Tax=Tritrichomonas foetus TaxID=1144522 RepID=A0A1J4KAC1_9EUKA|nr:AGC family protein kinase [Tritrichomonas foetus]|eukprot:OHT08375.1 AGC family protein kinase [Tritrichomonas foetus]
MNDIPIPCFSDDIYLQETKEWGLSLISDFIKNVNPSTIAELKITEHFQKLTVSSPEGLEKCIIDVIDTSSSNSISFSDETNSHRLQFLFLLLKIKHALHPLSQISHQLVKRWDRATRTPQRQPSNFLKNSKKSRTPTKNTELNRVCFDSPVKENKPFCRICECQINQDEFQSHVKQCLGCHSMKVEWQQINQEILSLITDFCGNQGKSDEQGSIIGEDECNETMNNENNEFYNLADIKKVIETSMFTSQLAHFQSKQIIDRIEKDQMKVPPKIVTLFKRRDNLMVEGTKLAKQAVESIFSEDSPNFNDGYSMPPLPLPRLHDFHIIAPISRGAFGSVFLCKRKQTGDIFALKAILADDYQTKNEVLDTEREVMCRASNPSVVSLYWSFRACGTIFFVMGFARGGDLFALLESVGSLEEETAVFYVAELINAVEYLHSLDVVHCDLKPDNILISDNGHLQLTDFGLSKFGAEQREFNRSLLFRFAQSQSPITEKVDDGSPRKRGIIGTPHYIAPESLLKSDYTPAADWWAVGAIAYELVVGQPPFIGDTESQVFSKIVAGKYGWPDDIEISDNYKKFVSDLLQLNPKKRPNAAALKKYEVFKDISFDQLYKTHAPFIPDVKDATDLSYFENARNANDVSVADFEELKSAVKSREKPDSWCCTNIASLAELNKDVLNRLPTFI